MTQQLEQLSGYQPASGTWWKDGIEYMDCHPPTEVVKFMKQEHALSLIHSGELRMQKLEYYRQVENGSLGDPDEGFGEYLKNANGAKLRTSSLNHTYIWCLSLPAIDANGVKQIIEEGEYDTRVVIRKPIEFFCRIRDSLAKDCLIQCGTIRYDRGHIRPEGVSYLISNFQKDERFASQCEYRIASYFPNNHEFPPEYLSLNIGNYEDLLSMEPLR